MKKVFAVENVYFADANVDVLATPAPEESVLTWWPAHIPIE